jgi:hypothetical protein
MTLEHYVLGFSGAPGKIFVHLQCHVPYYSPRKN